VCVSTCVFVCLCVQACESASGCFRVRVCMCICLGGCLRVYDCEQVCARLCVPVRVYELACLFVDTRVSTHIQAHRTHVCMCEIPCVCDCGWQCLLYVVSWCV